MKKVTLQEITRLVQYSQPFRILVTEETSTKIQEAIFAGGGKWITQKSKTVQDVLNLHPYMYIYFDNGEGGLYLYTGYSQSTSYNHIPLVELNDSFTREDHYIVLKRKDVNEYLLTRDQDKLNDIIDVINRNRLDDNKSPLQCVVVESDWPEYEKVWDMIETRIKEESKIRSLPEFMLALTNGKTLLDEYSNEYKIIGSDLLINNKHSSYYHGLNLTDLSTRTFTEL